MSLHASVRQPVLEDCTTERRLCLAPFEKGGYGGFAFDLDLEQQQEQIPLNPPFSKGEAELRAAEGGLATS